MSKDNGNDKGKIVSISPRLLGVPAPLTLPAPSLPKLPRTITQRLAAPPAQWKHALRQFSSDMRVAAPAIVQSFDPIKQTVSVRLAIKERVVVDGAIQDMDVDLISDVPLVLPRGGGFALTMPILPGDECLLIFGDRCMDEWWQSGSISKQVTGRQHDLSDAYAVMGVWSQPHTLPLYSPNSAMFRNTNGLVYIELTQTNINGQAPGTITWTAGATVPGMDMAKGGFGSQMIIDPSNINAVAPTAIIHNAAGSLMNLSAGAASMASAAGASKLNLTTGVASLDSAVGSHLNLSSGIAAITSPITSVSGGLQMPSLTGAACLATDGLGHVIAGIPGGGTSGGSNQIQVDWNSTSGISQIINKPPISSSGTTLTFGVPTVQETISSASGGVVLHTFYGTGNPFHTFWCGGGGNTFAMVGGATWDNPTSSWIARSPAQYSSGITFTGGGVYFYGNLGLTVGSSFTQINIATLAPVGTTFTSLQLKDQSGNNCSQLLATPGKTLDITGGAHYDGTNWIPDYTSATIISVGPSALAMYINTGLTVGTPIGTLFRAMLVDSGGNATFAGSLTTNALLSAAALATDATGKVIATTKGISSINGDSAAVQTLVAGANVTITDTGGGQHTISASGGGGGGPAGALSAIGPAVAANSINNAAWVQQWNWALGATGNGMVFAETSAGAGTGSLVQIVGLSTAVTALEVLSSETSQIHFGATHAVGGWLSSISGSVVQVSAGANTVNPGTWTAQAVAASIITLNPSATGGINFYGNTGLTVGSAYSPTLLATLDINGNFLLKSGGMVFGATQVNYSAGAHFISGTGWIADATSFSNIVVNATGASNPGGINFYAATGLTVGNVVSPSLIANFSSTGVLTVAGISTAGAVTTTGKLSGSYLYASDGGGFVPAGQGSYIAWNSVIPGTGEMDFIANRGGGAGGFYFFDCPSAGTPITQIASILCLPVGGAYSGIILNQSGVPNSEIFVCGGAYYGGQVTWNGANWIARAASGSALGVNAPGYVAGGFAFLSWGASGLGIGATLPNPTVVMTVDSAGSIVANGNISARAAVFTQQVFQFNAAPGYIRGAAGPIYFDQNAVYFTVDCLTTVRYVAYSPSQDRYGIFSTPASGHPTISTSTGQIILGGQVQLNQVVLSTAAGLYLRASSGNVIMDSNNVTMSYNLNVASVTCNGALTAGPITSGDIHMGGCYCNGIACTGNISCGTINVSDMHVIRATTGWALNVQNTANSQVGIFYSTDATRYVTFIIPNGGFPTWGVGGTSLMQFQTQCDNIGTTYGWVVRAVSGGTYGSLNWGGAGSSGANLALYSASGVINANAAITVVSDYRIKKNVKTLDVVLPLIMKMRPVSFDYVDSFASDGKHHAGFIAHELQEIWPGSVAGEKDALDEKGEGRFQGMQLNDLVALLTRAVQELSAKVDQIMPQFN